MSVPRLPALVGLALSLAACLRPMPEAPVMMGDLGQPPPPMGPPPSLTPVGASEGLAAPPSDALSGTAALGTMVASPPAAPAAVPKVLPTRPEASPPPRRSIAALDEDYRRPLGPLQLSSSTSAMRYAALSASECKKLVTERRLPVEFEAKAWSNVALAARITGPLSGVKVVTARAPSKFGVVDCRLALALDEMARLLHGHGVAEVRIGNTYRPGAKLGTGKHSQHAHALAADVSAFVRVDGTVVPVTDNWGAAIGDTPCGENADMTSPDERRLFLRNAVCALAREGVFHHILTPSANADHLDHFHFDIARESKNRFVR
ncbi:MAG: extensin family protein [Myxococcales bacterium]|nr:extensin family protein [Myxococcales bacterium]